MIDVHDAIRISRLSAEQRAYLRVLSRTQPRSQVWATIRGAFLTTLILSGLVWLACRGF